jgi:hypothetical protein
MTIPKIPKISPSELAAIAYGKATETVDTATAQIAAKTAEIEALASAGAAASKISVLSNSISTLSGGLAAAEALQELQLKKINFALLDDIEMPDFNVTLPTLTVADILALLPSLPTPPEFPPKLSISVKTLLNPSFGFGTPPGVPEIPAVISALLKMPPGIGNISGPGGSFSVGTNITQNVITTDTVITPAVNVGEMLTSPTIVTGNIASTTTLNLAATTAITLTAPVVTVTAPVVTLTSAAVSVSGTLTAATSVVSPLGTFALLSAPYKLFDIPHPSPGKENKRLKHGSLEGPELGVYVRGKTTDEQIVLPDYWVDLVDWNTITVQLTATTPHQQLYVNNIDASGVAVLGSLSAPYYYYIVAERKDVPKLEVESDA